MAYSVVLYTGDGATTTFAIPFPFIDQSHVTATVNGILQTISWINNGLIQLTPAPVAASSIIISRNSSQSIPIVVFQDAQVLTGADLDTATLQNLYVAQEAFDASSSATVAVAVQTNANAAAASATAAALSATNAAASAVLALTDANNAAASAAAAAFDVASISNTLNDNAPNICTTLFRESAAGNGTYDLEGSTLAATWVHSPTGTYAVTAAKTYSAFHADGNYKLNAGSNFVPFDVSITTDATSDPSGSVFGYRFYATLNAAAAVYGNYAQLTVANTVTGAAAYPMYLRVVGGPLASPDIVGTLLTLDSGAGCYFGNGIEVKGSTSAALIGRAFVIDNSVKVELAAFSYNVPTGGAPADTFHHAQQGEGDARFRITSDGNPYWGSSGFFGASPPVPRFFGNFSGTPHVARMLFTDSHEDPTCGFPVSNNVPTYVGALPAGTATQSGFCAYGAKDPDNTHMLTVGANTIANTVGVDSSKNGTGTVRDMVWSFDGTEKMRLSVAGALTLGGVAITAGALPLAGGVMTGPFQSVGYTGGTIAGVTGAGVAIEVVGAIGANAAWLGFNRASAFACAIGIDTDNNFKIGGWSMGAVAYQILHEGNSFTVTAPDLTTTKTLHCGALTGSSTGSFSGALSALAGLAVTGAATISTTLGVTGLTTLSGGVNVTGSLAATVNVTAAVFGATTSYGVGANQVVAARRTGWTAATGTASRGSFATSSVTLPNLAAAVKALIDDLIAHGLIGA